jgi:hypothetical protein
MMILFEAMPTDAVRAIRAGGPDAYGNPAERGAISDGDGVPCRHCLKDVPTGREYLILAHRPFPAAQPYAETGPIFLCADDCERGGGADVPAILTTSPDYLLKAYRTDDRIFYGTGRMVPKDDAADYAEGLLQNPDVAYVDVRSARNNCFQMRIRRAG